MPSSIRLNCDIKGGRLIVPNRAILDAQLARMPDGPVVLTVGPDDPIRSDRQARLYWKWLTILEDITGHSKDFLHAFFKDKFELSLESFSTTDAKRAAMTQYLSDLRTFAYEFFGVNLPEEPPASALEVTSRASGREPRE